MGEDAMPFGTPPPRSPLQEASLSTPQKQQQQQPHGGVVVLETPDGQQKKATAAENAHMLLTPHKRVKAPSLGAGRKTAALSVRGAKGGVATAKENVALVPKALMARTMGTSGGLGGKPMASKVRSSLRAASKPKPEPAKKATAARSRSTPAISNAPRAMEDEVPQLPMEVPAAALFAGEDAIPSSDFKPFHAQESPPSKGAATEAAAVTAVGKADAVPEADAVPSRAAATWSGVRAPWLPEEDPEPRSWNAYATSGRGELMEQRRRSREGLALKIGEGMRSGFDFAPGGRSSSGGDATAISRQASMPSRSVPSAEFQRVHAETSFRARSVQQRHRVDSVGSLLHSSVHSSAARAPVEMVSAPLGNVLNPVRVGRFQYRARDHGTHYEVEARIPGGELLRVSRNPLRRTITFEGQVRPAAGGAARRTCAAWF